MERRFTTVQAQQLTGLTYRQLDYWDTIGLIHPSGSRAAGSGSRREYTFTDLVKLRTVAYLRSGGISLQKIRKALQYIARILPQFREPLAELRFVALRDGTFAHVEGRRRYTQLVSKPGQMIFAVPFAEIAQETEHELAKLESKQALASEHIMVNQKVMGGAPVIRGTRIPVATVVKYARGGMEPTRIAKEFPELTVKAVRAALTYAQYHRRRGRPAKATEAA